MNYKLIFILFIVVFVCSCSRVDNFEYNPKQIDFLIEKSKMEYYSFYRVATTDDWYILGNVTPIFLKELSVKNNGEKTIFVQPRYNFTDYGIFLIQKSEYLLVELPPGTEKVIPLGPRYELMQNGTILDLPNGQYLVDLNLYTYTANSRYDIDIFNHDKVYPLKLLIEIKN
jgi:hypothetical protein